MSKAKSKLSITSTPYTRSLREKPGISYANLSKQADAAAKQGQAADAARKKADRLEKAEIKKVKAALDQAIVGEATAAIDENIKRKIKGKNVPELRAALTKMGQDNTGFKRELVDRLATILTAKQAAKAAADAAKQALKPTSSAQTFPHPQAHMSIDKSGLRWHSINRRYEPWKRFTESWQFPRYIEVWQRAQKYQEAALREAAMPDSRQALFARSFYDSIHPPVNRQTLQVPVLPPYGLEYDPTFPSYNSTVLRGGPGLGRGRKKKQKETKRIKKKQKESKRNKKKQKESKRNKKNQKETKRIKKKQKKIKNYN